MVPLQNLKPLGFEASNSLHKRDFDAQTQENNTSNNNTSDDNPNSQFGTNIWPTQSLIELRFPNSIKLSRRDCLIELGLPERVPVVATIVAE